LVLVGFLYLVKSSRDYKIYFSNFLAFNLNFGSKEFNSKGKNILGGTIKNYFAKIIGKLDSIFKIKFHLLIHWFI
jgi:hypothetical protein